MCLKCLKCVIYDTSDTSDTSNPQVYEVSEVCHVLENSLWMALGGSGELRRALEGSIGL